MLPVPKQQQCISNGHTVGHHSDGSFFPLHTLCLTGIPLTDDDITRTLAAVPLYRSAGTLCNLRLSGCAITHRPWSVKKPVVDRFTTPAQAPLFHWSTACGSQPCSVWSCPALGHSPSQTPPACSPCGCWPSPRPCNCCPCTTLVRPPHYCRYIGFVLRGGYEQQGAVRKLKPHSVFCVFPPANGHSHTCSW